MTAPQIIRQPGIGEQLQQGLAPLIAALANRQQIGLERQRLAIEQQRADAQTAQAGAATAESRARTKAQLEQLKQQDIQLRAQDFASDSFISTLTSAEGLTPESIARARETIITKGDKEIKSEALLAFDAFIEAEADQRRAVAAAQAAETESRVAEETAEDRIRAGQLADELAQAQVEQAEAATAASRATTEAVQVDTRLGELQEERDPNRVLRAQELWQSGGVTWGQAREAAGLAPGGIPDDEVFTPLGGRGVNQEARRAANFARQMISSDVLINELIEKTGGLTAFASLLRGTRSPTVDLLLTKLLKPEQRQLVQAQRAFTQAFRFSISGQQSSDREFLNILNQVSEQAGDDQETIRQKQTLRKLMIQGVLDAAAGTVSTVAVMDDLIEAAEAEGLGPERINYLRRERDLARQALRDQAAGRGPLSLRTDPTTSETLRNSVAVVDSLLAAVLDTTTVGGRR